jgi:drug/metabolite transporter (DMT)-like permease
VLIGSRLAQLMLCLSPIVAAVLGRFMSGASENLGWIEGVGIVIALIGVAIVIGQKRDGESHAQKREFQLGVWLAIVAACLYGLSLPVAKLGKTALEGEVILSPLESNLIRIAGGLVLFYVFIPLTGRTRDTIAALKNAPAMGLMLLGAIAGPLVGVTALMASTRYLPSGVVATITALVPVTIIPLSMIVKKERVTVLAIVGSCVAVAGVIVLGLASNR